MSLQSLDAIRTGALQCARSFSRSLPPHVDVEDIVAEVVLAALERSSSGDIACPKGWGYQAAKYRSLNLIAKRRAAVELDPEMESASTRSPGWLIDIRSEHAFNEVDTRLDWHTLSGSLTPMDRLVIEMRHDGYTLPEIGERIGRVVPRAAVGASGVGAVGEVTVARWRGAAGRDERGTEHKGANGCHG